MNIDTVELNLLNIQKMNNNLHVHLRIKQHKLQYYFALAFAGVGAYSLYALSTDFGFFEGSVLEFFSLKLVDRLLPALIIIASIINLVYWGGKGSLVFRTESITNVKIILSENSSVLVNTRTKSKFLKGVSTVLENDISETDFIENLELLTGFKEKSVTSNDSTSYSLSGVSSAVDYGTGNSLNLSKTVTKGVTQYTTIAVFSDGTQKDVWYGESKLKKLNEIFKTVIEENNAD